MTRGLVSLDGIVTVEAAYDPMERWNGFLCPRMDRTAVDTVMAALATYDDECDPMPPSHVWDGSTLILTEYDDTDAYRTPIEPDGDGLYALGAGAWVWQKA